MSKAENMKNTAYMLEKRSGMMVERARMDGTLTPAEEKLVEHLEDKAFVQKLLNCGSAEAVKNLMDQNCIDIAMEEIQSMLAMIGTLAQKLEENDGELSDEELETVAGGWSWMGALVGAVAGFIAALCVVAAAVVLEGVSFGTATPLILAGGAVVGGAIIGVLT